MISIVSQIDTENIKSKIFETEAPICKFLYSNVKFGILASTLYLIRYENKRNLIISLSNVEILGIFPQMWQILFSLRYDRRTP